ncbi:MAG: hypothetical protein ACRDSR_04655 [Pseudonocardiaceae bacterium]
MLTDPREALAEQGSFVNGLVGLAGLAHLVRALAADGNPRVATAGEADDFVHLLLAVASLGAAVGHLGTAADLPPASVAAPSTTTRWLR